MWDQAARKFCFNDNWKKLRHQKDVENNKQLSLKNTEENSLEKRSKYQVEKQQSERSEGTKYRDHFGWKW